MVHNRQVKKVGYRVVGHTHERYIYLFFGDGEVRINPNAPWFVEKGFNKLGNKEYTQPIMQLFSVFGIDPENGVDIEELKGKYFRLHTDDKSDKIIALQHIVEDHIIVLVEDLK